MGIVVILGLIFGRGLIGAFKKGASDKRINKGTLPMNVQYPGALGWKPYIDQLIAAFPFIPVTFVLQWIEMESGGNPCSIGFPGETDFQGQPLETGLFQLMSPHDIKLAGTSVAEMRQCCSGDIHFPGLTRYPTNKDPNSTEYKAWYQLEAQSRFQEQSSTCSLTDQQKLRQIQVGLTYIIEITNIIDNSFKRYNGTWSKHTNDYWNMVKAFHAGSAIPTTGVDYSYNGLGKRFPQNWDEFKQGLHNAIGSKWDSLLNNAEKCGSHAFPRQPGA